MSIPHFHTLKIKDITKEMPDCVSVALDITPELKSSFQYQAGQYITFKKVIQDEEVRRSYSLCSSPLEDDFRVAIKQIKGGLFSTFANQDLKIGDEVEVMTPMGNFTSEVNATAKRNYLAFAAGSGITPMLSLIKTILWSEPQSTFTLIYGNQSIQTILFKEELEALKNRYMERFQIVHILSRERMETELNYGRINAEKCEQLSTHLIDFQQMDQFFICGPEEMILGVKDYLIQKGVDEHRIRFELFTNSSSIKTRKAYQEAHQEESEKMCHVTIKVDDRSFDLQLAYGGDSILDAALKSGADLPFACKGGVCCTCRAKVVEGTVDMEVNYALEKDEVARGYVLTCQSHPTSDRVVIDFDVR